MTNAHENATGNHPATSTMPKVPYTEFLGIREEIATDGHRYLMDFRDEHMGNPLIKTFHGGILASFGEVCASMHLMQSSKSNNVPECASMTFDYLRPAFAGTLIAKPTTLRAGRRITIVKMKIFLGEKLVCSGRFIFKSSTSADAK